MRAKRTWAAPLLAAAALVAAAAPASAKELRVDNDRAQCPNAQFVSIQQAVTAAGPNDTVKVCPGTYPEQVKIEGSAKRGLKVEALRPLEATIQAPPVEVPPNAIVRIANGANDVTLRGFVVRGPFVVPGCVEPALAHTGVFVDNAFDARIRENRVTEIRNSLPSLFGCQDGISVLVGRSSQSSVGSADVSQNVIDEYQKGGVVVDNAGSDADVDHNEIAAADEVQNVIAPNGVQISRGATARVDHNEVSQNVFLGNPNAGNGTGILLFEPRAGGVRVDHNDVSENDDGIDLTDADRERVEENRSHDNRLYDGIFVNEDSAGNLIKGNLLFGNTEHDCHDDSVGGGTGGTANEWKGDRGNTENRPDLCQDAVVTP